MKNLRCKVFFVSIFIAIFFAPKVFSCTNLLVTKGASTDGSVMITYTCDGEFHPHMRYISAADYASGDSMEIKDRNGVMHKVPQVSHTYSVVSFMNEYQLAISETTFDGRRELHNPEGLFHYNLLIRVALQRAKTAREAIQVITSLVDEYGYRSTGESFSIADTKEAWILELIGMGVGRKGAVWVARKIPDGYISAHANKARISTFPLNDKENCLYSPNVISFAIEKGYYNPKSKEPFRFNEAYCPSTPKNQRYASARVWSLFRRAAPSLNLSADYHRAVEGADPYPLWIKPDKKISTSDVFDLMRDHYEGTDFDMTKGIDAGPYATPNRWRPMVWEVDGQEYAWERPISTQQTGFSFVTQSRSWLPNSIGGVLWYGMDDTYTSCYFPLYCGINKIPESYTVGSIKKFSWESAWWVFNFVANYANLKYSYMYQDIKTVQQELEQDFLNRQAIIEEAALALNNIDKELLTTFLTDYSVSKGEMVFERWRELGESLITKYNDGYIKDKNGRPRENGYSEEWSRKVLKERPNQFKLKENKNKGTESRLID